VGDPFVCVAIKPIAAVLDVDWLTGRVDVDPRHVTRTRSDEAACAVGYELAASLGCEAVVVAACGPAGEGVLRATLAEGAGRAVRVVVGDEDRDFGVPAEQWPSEVVAAALCEVATGAVVIVCGDASGDRGSGTVPARIAHHLDLPQALCLRTVGVDAGGLVGSRRLDGGRREHLALAAPCVLSVEAGAGAAPRASLTDALGAVTTPRYEVVAVSPPRAARRGDPPGAVVGPVRPRPSVVAAPTEVDPVRRGIELAGSLVVHDPPEVVRCDPEEAADVILDRLERWGMR
jgi:electron transfer flavoprotein beta subunit